MSKKHSYMMFFGLVLQATSLFYCSPFDIFSAYLMWCSAFLTSAWYQEVNSSKR